MTKVRHTLIGLILILTVPSILSGQEEGSRTIHFIPDSQYYGVARWDADSLGNHRAVLRVLNKTDAVRAHIPWRRRDMNPEEKETIIVDGSTGRRIKNVYRARINREFGDILFQPETAPGDYYVYFLPSISTGSKYYPKVTYRKPVPSFS